MAIEMDWNNILRPWQLPRATITQPFIRNLNLTQQHNRIILTIELQYNFTHTYLITISDGLRKYSILISNTIAIGWQAKGCHGVQETCYTYTLGRNNTATHTYMHYINTYLHAPTDR